MASNVCLICCCDRIVPFTPGVAPITVLGAGHSIASNIPQAAKYVKDIDIDLLIDAIENELDGQIIDIRSGKEDTVTVVIE